MYGPEECSGYVLTQVQVRMSWRLGQGGAVGWRHEPRAVVEVARDSTPDPVCLVVERPAVDGDGAPRTMGALARRVPGQVRVTYASGLYPDGPTTVGGVTPEGTKTRVPLPAFDRWVLIEWITVRWDEGRGGRRGFALWCRSGRGNWRAGKAWWRGVDGGWRHGRTSDVPFDA